MSIGYWTSYAGPQLPADPVFSAIKSRNPIGYWRLDETSGTTAIDYSGNGNNGTYLGPTGSGIPTSDGYELSQAVLLPGSRYSSKKYVSFSGNSDVGGRQGQVNISDIPLFNLTSGTIMGWVKTNSTGITNAGNCIWIFGKQSQYSMLVQDESFSLGGGVLSSYDFAGGHFISSTALLTRSGSPLPHFVAMTFAFGVSNGSKLYVDGVPVLTFTLAGASGTSYAVSIGDSAANPPVQPMIGPMGECAIFSTILSDVDIAAINAAGQ